MALAAVGRARSCAAARVRLAGRAGLGAFLLVALSAAAFGQQPLELPQSVPRQIFTFGPEFLKAATVVAGSWVLAARGEGEHLPGMLLVQRAVNNAYNVIAMPGPIYEDLDIHVRFMPISGREDASGGIVFRFDRGRYYLVRANALEDNFRLYYYDGSRHELASARVSPPALGRWSSLRVVAVGDHFQVYLEEKLRLDSHDTRIRAGRVGLWTKADSVTAFDELTVRGKTAPR